MTAFKRMQMPLLAALALLFLLPASSLAEPVGAFTRVEGGVDLLRAGSAAPVPVRIGDPVSLGDAVRTKRSGKAEIRFRDETAIQVAPESRILIDEYSFGPGETRDRGLLSLFRGKVRAIVSKAKAVAAAVGRTDAGFSIKTPTAIAGVKGTDFIVYYQRGVSGVIFVDGIGFAYNPQRPDRVVVIRRGEAAFIPDAVSPPSDAQPVSGSFVESHVKDMNVSEAASEGDGAEQASEGGVVAQSDATGREGEPARAGAAGQEDAAGREGQTDAAGREGPPVTASESNTTYVALTNQLGIGDGGGPLQGFGGPSSVTVRGSEPSTPPAPPPPPPPIIPVTERPDVIKPRTTTPVTVNVTLP